MANKGSKGTIKTLLLIFAVLAVVWGATILNPNSRYYQDPGKVLKAMYELVVE